MESLLAFLIASVVTLFFVRNYVKGLSAQKRASAGSGAAASGGPQSACPRCGKPIAGSSAFCQSCGASMALWNVHRATVQDGPQGADQTGRPRPVINATLCIGCGSCVDACPETGTLELSAGKAILANPERCTGHKKCVDVCPTSAIQLAIGSVLQTLRVPLVNENFETNVAGVYIVGELSGMGLIKTAINEGRLAVDRIRQKLEADGAWSPPVLDQHSNGVAIHMEDEQSPYDLIIVGSGPAGLSASLAAHQSGLRYLTLEQGEIAATIRNYPRHKFLMAEPTEMPLYGTLYIGDGTKEALLKVWEAIVANTGVRVKTNIRVEGVSRVDDRLRVETSSGEFFARNVILALGKRGSPRKLGVAGEELTKVSYGLIEADTYNDNDILVVGGGDSAIEAALALSKAGKNRVALSYRGGSFDRARDRNRAALLEREQAGMLRILKKSNVKDISQREVRLEVGGQEVLLPNDFVFILIGGEPPETFLMKTGVQIVEKVIQ